jgi:four helix bundle protein
MARDYNKLDAFHLADDFAVLVYERTRRMSDADNIRTQLRRAATSAPQNICEGCARRSTADYARFLDIALSSATEAVYVLRFCKRVALLTPEVAEECRNLGKRAIKALQKLLDAVEQLPDAHRAQRAPTRAVRRGD